MEVVFLPRTPEDIPWTSLPLGPCSEWTRRQTTWRITRL